MELDEAAKSRREWKKAMRVFLAALIALFGAGVVLAIYVSNISEKSAAESDFISYWSAGHLLVRGQNPYDFEAVRALEAGAGRDANEPVLMMRNPPVAFFMVAPFGWVGAKTGVIIWLFILIGALSLASFLIWRLNGNPDSLFNFFGFGFAPVLACLMAGQCGILLLLGVVCFLSFYRNRPFLAGCALLLCALKPHFFAPFGIALLIWCFTAKKGIRILAGFCVGIGATCALAYALDPSAWSEYSRMVQTGGALNEVVPKLSAELRLLIDPRAVWIQFAAEGAACVWAVWYFWTRRVHWDWMDHGLLLLLVGAVCTPYGFLPDESLLLPAVMAGVFRSRGLDRSEWLLGVITVAALVELGMGATIISRWYLWTTPAWLVWYLYATGRFPQTGPVAQMGKA